MIIKCTNCSSALIYDVALGKMKCKYCDSEFEVEEIECSTSKKKRMQCDILILSEF